MRAFERLLWSARFLMIIPIIGSSLASVGTLLLGIVTLFHAIPMLAGALQATPQGAAPLERALLATIIKSVDIFLFSAFLIIFPLGLYELFIQRIATEDAEIASSLLIIRSLDDLKDRLIKIVILLLVVEFLQEALSLLYHTPQDLLYLAGSILLVGFAVFLTNRTGHRPEP